MKKFLKMILKIKRVGVIRHLLSRKNMQIRAEREKYQAEKAANSILTAYVFLLASQCGIIRIPKSAVSAAIGKYKVTAYSDGDDYVIELDDTATPGEEALRGKTGSIQAMVR